MWGGLFWGEKVSYRYFTIEIVEIIVQSLLKTNRLQSKMAATFTLDFVAKVFKILHDCRKCPNDRGGLYKPC